MKFLHHLRLSMDCSQLSWSRLKSASNCYYPLSKRNGRIGEARYSIYTSKETIFSLSSGHGKCGVSVIRISGSGARQAMTSLGRFKDPPPPRLAVLRTLYDQQRSIPIDHGLVLWFPGPASFTGEDCVEFQVHGGPAVVTAMVTALSEIPGFRQAEAGEFSKRAFFNNKLDLTEIEGLGDLIHAETEAQRRQALRQMEGNLGNLYNKWRSEIIKMMANVEAFIDFSEDDNIEEDVLDHVNTGVKNIKKNIEEHLNDNRRGEMLRSGVRVTILGEPNVGKSSLLNLLAQRPAAIVSDIAGTTRDIVESSMNISGYPVLLSDTAGLRESCDVIEKEGVRRALERARQSDIQVIMISADDIEIDETLNPAKSRDLLSVHVSKTLERLGVSDSVDNDVTGKDVIVVINKSDLVNSDWMNDISKENDEFQFCITSCVDESGITEFLETLKQRLDVLCGNPLEGNPSLTQARHRNHLTNCLSHLEKYQQYIDKNDVVLAAECLRKATREIGKLTGKITSEDILDVIFKDFCIGK